MRQHLIYDNGQCAICLSPHTRKSRLVCGHVFCYKCLREWSKRKYECPLCKQVFNSFATTDLDSTLWTGVLNMPIDQRLEDSLPQLPDIIPLVFTVYINGNTTDFRQFLSNPLGFLASIVLGYGLQLNSNEHRAVIIYKNVTTEQKNLLQASLERPGIQHVTRNNVEFSNWALIEFAKTILFNVTCIRVLNKMIELQITVSNLFQSALLHLIFSDLKLTQQ